MLTEGGFNLKKVFSTFQTCALNFELKKLLRKCAKIKKEVYFIPMKVMKSENKLYESELFLQGTLQDSSLWKQT